MLDHAIQNEVFRNAGPLPMQQSQRPRSLQNHQGDQAVLLRGVIKPSMIALADLISSSLIVWGIPG